MSRWWSGMLLYHCCWCFAHDPALREKREQARSKGGRNRATARRAQKFLPSTLAPILDQLTVAMDQTFAGAMDAKTAHALAALSRAIVAVVEHGTLEERIAALEAGQTGGQWA
jgi:hypothetical protein